MPDIYNIKNAGAVGRGAQNNASLPPSQPPPEPPKRTNWKGIAGGAVAAVLAISSLLFLELRPTKPVAPENAETATEQTLLTADQTIIADRTESTNDNRIALVIHQQNYQHKDELSTIIDAEREADLIADALRQTGFAVRRASDLSQRDLLDRLDAFRLELEGAGPDAIAFIYYTGHGAQHPRTGNSYLLGTDARLRLSSDLAQYGIDMEKLRDGYSSVGAKAVFLVFDACRNRPQLGDFMSSVKGMGRVEATPGMFIAYSTDLNDVAEAGVFAPVLAEEIVRPGQTVATTFSETQTRVATNTGNKQRPWSDNRILEKLCFNGCDPPAVPLTCRLDRAKKNRLSWPCSPEKVGTESPKRRPE